MGIFGGQKAVTCGICNTTTGTGIDKSYKAANGFICENCNRRLKGLPVRISPINMLKMHIEEIERQEKEAAAFNVSKVIGGIIEIDDLAQKWRIPEYDNRIFNLVDTKDVWTEVQTTTHIETNEKKHKGISRAVIGHIVAGPAGAIVASSTAKRTSQGVSNDIIEASANWLYQIDNTTETVYSVNCESERIANIIVNGLKGAMAPASDGPALSAADEIRKFKALYDEGIITEEEFTEKKKQLLGL